MVSTGTDLRDASTILDVLANRARTHADHVAYGYGDETLSFAQVHAGALNRARALSESGLSRGGRCALILPTSLELVRLIYAVQLCGAAPVLLDPLAPPRLLARRIRQCRPGLAIVTSGLRDSLTRELAANPDAPRFLVPDEISVPTAPPHLPEVSPEDTAYLQFTSGTTGEPKIVVVSHYNLIWYLARHREHLIFKEDDVLLSWAPLFHDLGLVGTVFMSLYAPYPCYLLAPEISSLKVWLQTVSRLGASITSGPDFGYRYVTRAVAPEEVDLSRLRFAGSGGEVVRIDTIRRFEERFGLSGVSVGGYGQAESVMCLSLARPEDPIRVDAAGNVANGRPLPGVELRIVDDEGRVLQAGEVGNIIARAESIFSGYFEDEAATREVLRDGWLHTGDFGYLDAEGYLFILGRTKSLIKRGGSIIAPREVEMAAEQVPGVRVAAAIGVLGSSNVASEELIVFVEVSANALRGAEERDRITEAVVAAVAESVGHSPSNVVLFPPYSIPRTPNGKIQHGLLKKIYAGSKVRSGRPVA
jgi:acyl-CoA synthetase (AMP-forming)/AMP-acid ligase II